MKSIRRSVGAFMLSWLLCAGSLTAALAADPPSSAGAASVPVADASQAPEKTEIFMSLFMQGSYPLNRPVRLQTTPSRTPTCREDWAGD
ncbi:MAG: hypothetical protein H0V35_07585 [Nitrospira sp.]|nr:hypothetical protein [Nitrospira sp.]